MPDRIDSGIDPSFFTEIQRAIVSMDALGASAENTSKSLIALSTGPAPQSIKELADALNRLNTATQDITATSKQYRVERDSVMALEQKLINLETERARQEADLKVQISEKVTAMRNEARTANDVGGAYGNLSREYNVVSLAARNYILTLGVQNQITKDAIADAAALSKQLKDVDAAVGINTRNVGNYGSAFRKAWGIIRQAAYILPGIGISGILMVGAEAIGSLFTWISGADKVIDRLKTINEIAEKSNNTFSQSAVAFETLKARFESTTATMADKQSVVDELNRSYANQIGKLEGINDAEKFFRDKSDAFVQALQLRAQAAGALAIVQQNAQKETELLANPEKALSGMQKYLVGVKSLVQGLGTFNGQNIVDKFNENYDFNAAAKGGAEANEQIRMLGESSKFALGQLVALQQAAEKLDQKNGFNTDEAPGKKLKKTPADKMDADGTKERLAADKASNELDIAEQTRQNEREAALYEAAAKDERYTLEERLTFYDNYVKAKKMLIFLANTKESANAQDQLDTLNDKEKQYNEGKLKLTQYQLDTLHKQQENAQRLLLDINKKGEDQYTELTDKGAKDRADIRESERQQDIQYEKDTLEIIKASFADQYNSQRAALDKRNLSRKQYNEELANLEKKIQMQILDQQIDQINEVIQADKIEGIATKELTVILDALLKKRAELSKDKTNGNVFGFDDKTLSNLKDIIDTAKSLLNSYNDLSGALSKKRQQDAQNEIDLISKKRDADIAAINSSLLSEDKKAVKIAEINARSQAQEDTANAKKRQEQIKDAERDKAIKLALAIISGALFVLQSKNIPEAILRAITVAAQVAVIAATPIPSFEVGTENAPEGLAKVHEGELVLKSGKPYYVNSDTYTYLSSGDKVKTAADTAEIFKYYGVGMPALRTKDGKEYAMDEIMDGAANKIVRAIERKGAPSQSRIPLWWKDYYDKKTR